MAKGKSTTKGESTKAKAEGIVVSVDEIRDRLDLIESGRQAVSQALNGAAVWFRETLMPRAGGNYGIAWTAFSKAVRAYYAEGIDDDDDDATKDAESNARSVLQSVRNRVRDLMPESKTAKAQKASKGEAVQANTVTTSFDDLLTKALTLLNAAAGRLSVKGDDAPRISDVTMRGLTSVTAILSAYHAEQAPVAPKKAKGKGK